jgi:hypothetical protein
MRNSLLLLSLAAAGVVLASTSDASPYAATVVSYNPGAGYVAGYTNTSTILGQPSTNGVDPFDAAGQTNQLLSIGAGGWVTVGFDRPIVHYPGGNRDFIVFGNSSFNVTNESADPDLWSTDGAVTNQAGQTQVSVSRDGVTFYSLNPALAPTVDLLYPTDGSGDFRLPVSPGLTPTNFAGLTLADIRLLYNGSAGGASYDIAWAQDTNGNPVCLPDIRYVRVDAISNSVELAGFAAIAGTILAEDFSNNPAANGWQAFGDTNLFTWDATNQSLQVTWDSSQSNSYYYHPLGTIMTSNDAFSLSFDIQLNDASTNQDGSYQFELAIGFLNLAEAENTNFLRGSGDNATNLAEFDYFPPDDQGDGPSLAATLLDSNGNYYFPYADVPLVIGTLYHVSINHAAGTGTLTGEILANGQFYTSLPADALDVYPTNSTAGDFRLDTVSVDSYSDVDGYGGSILAHGIVRNLFIAAPPPPVTYLAGSFTNNFWQVQFWSRTNWTYTLETSADLQSWSALAPTVAGAGGQMALQDTNVPTQSRYYRVSANPQ